MSQHSQYPIAVMLTSRDMSRSLSFYRDQLGFQLQECWPDEQQAMWANLVLDGQSVMLGAAVAPEHATEMCGGNEAAAAHMKTLAEELQKNKPGVGVTVYLRVSDVDAYHRGLAGKGLKGLGTPTTQFYGQRDFGVSDPDGYRLTFYTPVALSSCQSCGMPLQNAEPGQMYCQYCTDEKGHLKAYETVLAGTTGYFASSHKMPKDQADKAAREHLAKMPAWAGKK